MFGNLADCDPGDKQYITNATALQSKPPKAHGMHVVEHSNSGYICLCWPNLCHEEL